MLTREIISKYYYYYFEVSEDVFVSHPAGTSIVSDICDLSNISDIAPLTLGSMEKVFFTTYFVSHRNPISVKINGKYIYRKI